MRKKHSGFTLMELMVTLAVASVLLGLAVPNFRDFIRNSRLTSAANDLIGALNAARTEAIKRQLPVAVCATGDATASPPVCSGGAYTAWVVWVDANNNWIPDNVAAEQVLVRHETLDPSVLVRVDGAETGVVKFRPSGFAADPSGGFVPTSNIVICDVRGSAATSGGTSAARALLITATGRARVTRDKGEIDTALGLIGDTCP